MPGPVFLRGERVTLHPIEPDDAPFLAEVLNDPRVRQGISHVQPMSEAAERDWVESLDPDESSDVNLLICADDEPVGTIGLGDVVDHWGVAELGYMIDPDAWDNGYATDAVGAIVDYGFDELRLAKVRASAFAWNDASIRVLEKAGFTHEGSLRDHALVDGERVDLEVFGLLPAER